MWHKTKPTKPNQTSDNRFLIGFRLELVGGLSSIFSPVNLSYSKDSRVNLDTREESLSRINERFPQKLQDLYHAKKGLSIKSS